MEARLTVAALFLATFAARQPLLLLILTRLQYLPGYAAQYTHDDITMSGRLDFDVWYTNVDITSRARRTTTIGLNAREQLRGRATPNWTYAAGDAPTEPLWEIQHRCGKIHPKRD